MFNKTLRIILTILIVISGLVLSNQIIPYLGLVTGRSSQQYGLFGIAITTFIVYCVFAIIFGVLGYFISPYLLNRTISIISWFETRLNKMPIKDVIAGAIGLAIGLIISYLVGSNFLPIPIIGKYIPGVASIILGYLGIKVAIEKREELFSVFPTMSWINKDRQKEDSQQNPQPILKILDTSVIIDGRIADICKSGFVEGVLIIPGFVLEELQHIADSSDLLKRNRGRRGLDILNYMQKELKLNVQIDNRDFEDIIEVDSKLIKLAQLIKANVITNDYNLNKVAELQGVFVLNINELSNAVKPVVIPGEEMIVHVVKDGKENGQGVAYLDDGTMIVVDGGKNHMGETIGVLVTSVLQTAAGRMIFAKPRGA